MDLHFLRRGEGGPAVVVLHGQLGVAGVVAPLAESIDDRVVLAPDVRGRGASVCRDRALHSWDRYVDDLWTLLDFNDIEAATIVGVSLGAGVGIAAALQRPERVQGLVLWASPYRGAEAGWDDRQRESQATVLVKAEDVLQSGLASALETRRQ